MRALHVYAGNLYGGIEAMLATLARHRDACPWLEPEFALCHEGRLADELRRAGATAHHLGPARLSRPWAAARARSRLARVLADRGIDVLVCHACWPHALFARSARRAGIPLVFWMHDRADGRHVVDRLAARTPPDLALVNSHATATTLPRLFPDAPREVLYYPVAPPPPADRAELRARVRRALGTDEAATVIVLASRLEPWKGHSLLLSALGRLRGRAGWEAWVAGGVQRPRERAYLDRLRSEADAAGVADRVRFLGQRDDVPRLLAAADVHCQPNLAPEPFGIAFVEALYAGLPAVTTRLGAAPEIVDGGCGVLVEPGDAGGLAGALGRLIDDPGARARLGAAGPARAAGLCDPAAQLGRLAGLLSGLRDAGPRPACGRLGGRGLLT